VRSHRGLDGVPRRGSEKRQKSTNGCKKHGLWEGKESTRAGHQQLPRNLLRNITSYDYKAGKTTRGVGGGEMESKCRKKIHVARLMTTKFVLK